MKRSGIQFCALMTLICLFACLHILPDQASATMIDATGFASPGPDNTGIVMVQGFHAAVLNLVSVEHANKNWTLSGEIHKCTIFFSRLGSSCTRSGNTNTSLFLSCGTGADASCLSLSSGVRALTTAGLVNVLDVRDSEWSSCSTPTCSSGCGGGGCPDPPQEHSIEPKAGRRPLILAIEGRGAFAENHLALLYDDGFDADSTHRLAFVTLAPQEALGPTRVYSTQKLPAIFEAQYGHLQTTLASEPVEDERLQALFKEVGAYAAIDLGTGQQIGLVEQLHQEDWFIDLSQYSKRYRHDRGETVSFSVDPSDPVTLNLATVFIWNGEAWVTDPLLVLEALSDVFVASTAELAQLRSALRR